MGERGRGGGKGGGVEEGGRGGGKGGGVEKVNITSATCSRWTNITLQIKSSDAK